MRYTSFVAFHIPQEVGTVTVPTGEWCEALILQDRSPADYTIGV